MTNRQPDPAFSTAISPRCASHQAAGDRQLEAGPARRGRGRDLGGAGPRRLPAERDVEDPG
jgi:hypothetical protein